MIGLYFNKNYVRVGNIHALYTLLSFIGNNKYMLILYFPTISNNQNHVTLYVYNMFTKFGVHSLLVRNDCYINVTCMLYLTIKIYFMTYAWGAKRKKIHYRGFI